jgi:hypothetical protein
LSAEAKILQLQERIKIVERKIERMVKFTFCSLCIFAFSLGFSITPFFSFIPIVREILFLSAILGAFLLAVGFIGLGYYHFVLNGSGGLVALIFYHGRYYGLREELEKLTSQIHPFHRLQNSHPE